MAKLDPFFLNINSLRACRNQILQKHEGHVLAVKLCSLSDQCPCDHVSNQALNADVGLQFNWSAPRTN